MCLHFHQCFVSVSVTRLQVMERNPEIARALQDPQTLRQAMDMIRNPSLMQEMTRNTDRALSNLDAVPGGCGETRGSG